MRVRPPNMEPIWDGNPMKPKKAPDQKPPPEPDDAMNERLRKRTVIVYRKATSKESQQ